MVEETLQQAYQFIKTGEKALAEALLRRIVADDADNADAWWLLANAVDDPDDIREALDHVLRLRPDHAKAQLMLKRTNARFPSDEPESIEDLLAAEFDTQAPRRVIVTKPKRQNNLLIIVLIIGGVLSMIGCAACAVMAGGMVMLEEVINDPELAGLMDILVEGIAEDLVSRATVDQGTIERGQTVRDDLAPLY